MGKHMTVSASEANRSFSKLLRAAQEGAHVTITSHGKVVAELHAPFETDMEKQQRQEAFAKMKERWARTEPITVGPWRREDLYERD